MTEFCVAYSDGIQDQGWQMNFRNVICMSAVATCIAASAFAQGLPRASQPEDLGFSSERLKRVTSAFQADVDKGTIPGAVVLIARNGKVAYFEAIGFQDREKKIPMSTDAIFRIASMTKPFTSVATMMLVEEGKILLNGRVSVYLPEFKALQVGVEKINAATGNPELTLEAAQREMTIEDLLRHTSGLTYSFLGKSLVKQAYSEANVFDPNQTLAEFVTKLSKLPLAHQPGTTWDYSMSTDVLGRVVEVVSGVPFDQFIADRIVKPLGLSDTGFWVAAEKLGRLAEAQVDPATGKRPALPDVISRPNWLSGGGGMVSTASDYVRFSQMLLNGGELDSVRLLSPYTVALMTTNQTPPDIAYSREALQIFEPLGIAPTPRDGQGFGLGFMVRTQTGQNMLPGSPGVFYWQGAWGTAFWVDPKQKLIAVLMVQVSLLQGSHYQSLIRNLVYQSLMN
ncbi:MAG: serine hydrolase domain-containing protein [Beijerinckiaceae bacterium]